MAGRGFEVQDLLVKDSILLNIPPFKGGKQSWPEDDVKKTEKIACVRIHVKQAIGQVKSRFRWFQGIIPITLFGCLNQLWTVTSLLTNFCGPLIAEDSTSEE